MQAYDPDSNNCFCFNVCYPQNIIVSTVIIMYNNIFIRTQRQNTPLMIFLGLNSIIM